MYLPRSQAPGWEEIADLVLEDVTQLRARVCREYGITHFAYAADVNVELQPWIAEYTGGGLHVPIARSEGAREKERREEEQKLREKVEGWMVGQHLRASNSFGARLPTWNRYQLHSRPSVLDYVFIFQWVVVKGEAQVDTLYQGSARDARARLSDHALLRVGVALPHGVLARRYLSRRARSLKHWQAEDWREAQSTRRLFDATLPMCQSIEQLETLMHANASSTTCAPSARASPPKKPDLLVDLSRDLYARRGEKGADACRKVRRQHDRLERRFKRAKVEWEAQRAENRRRPLTHVLIDGKKVVDRRRWEQEVRDKVGNNCTDEEALAFSEQIVADLRRRVRGSPVPPEAQLQMSQLLQARAELKVGKATGPDGLSAAVLRHLPWRSLRVVLRFFNLILTGMRAPPDSWLSTLTSLMRKSQSGCTVENTRRLAVESVIKTWNSTAVLSGLEPYLARARAQVALFGFCPGRACSEVTAGLKTVAQHASQWGKDRAVLIASADLKQAFQRTTVSAVYRALTKLEVPVWLQRGILAPLVGEVTTLLFEGVSVLNVHVDRHIRTGGNESPDLWNLIVCAMWSDVLREWDALNIGFPCWDPNYLNRNRGGGGGGVGEASQEELQKVGPLFLLVNHLIYADNVFVLGSDLGIFQKQLTTLTSVLRLWGFEWKIDSQAVLVIGFSCVIPTFTVDVEGEQVPLARVSCMNVLCNDVYAEYKGPRGDVSRRICAAHRAFYKHIAYFRCSAVSWAAKCRKYVSLVQSVLLYGSEGFTWDSDSLGRIHVFEGRCLYHMAASRKPPGAQWQLWRPARLRWCREQLQKQRLQPAVQRALHSAWWLGQDVAGYFAERSGEYASVEQTNTVDGPQDDLPERAPAPKRRRLGPRAAQGEGVQHCASRAMCDARRLLVCYTYGLAQELREEEGSPRRRWRGCSTSRGVWLLLKRPSRWLRD